MKKRLQSLPRRRKQQSSFKREQIPETEKRTGDTAENCSYAYLRYLFARLYLTTLGNYAFASSDKLVSVKLSKNLENIGDYTF